MRYLMLMWADADAASGDESDLQAWVEFDAQVKAAGAFVLNGALAPAASEARLVQTAIAGHDLGEAVERRPFAEGKRQIQAFYIMDLPDMDAAVEWANRLPTYGYVEVRELLQFTAQFNVTGQPAISLPLYWTADGLPVGVQLVAGFGREDVLVRIAAQLEAAQPWASRRPPVSA